MSCTVMLFGGPVATLFPTMLRTAPAMNAASMPHPQDSSTVRWGSREQKVRIGNKRQANRPTVHFKSGSIATRSGGLASD